MGLCESLVRLFSIICKCRWCQFYQEGTVSHVITNTTGLTHMIYDLLNTVHRDFVVMIGVCMFLRAAVPPLGVL
jgi:hypothetical protein